MVKRKARFYQLSELFPIKHAFQGLEGTGVLYANACPLSTTDRPGTFAAAVVRDHFSKGRDAINSNDRNHLKNFIAHKCKERVIRRCNAVHKGLLGLIYLPKKKRKIRRHYRFKDHIMKGTKKAIHPLYGNKYAPGITSTQQNGLRKSAKEDEPREEGKFARGQDTPSERSSEIRSVTSIINRYFSDFEEVNQYGNCSNSVDAAGVIENQQEEPSKVKAYNISSETGETPKRVLLFSLSHDTTPRRSGSMLEKVDVGARLLTASTKLGVSSRKQPIVSIFRYKDGKHFGMHSSSVVKSLAFEISDDDG